MREILTLSNLGCRWIANKFHKDTFSQSMHQRLWQHLDSQTDAVKMPKSVMSVLKRS